MIVVPKPDDFGTHLIQAPAFAVGEIAHTYCNKIKEIIANNLFKSDFFYIIWESHNFLKEKYLLLISPVFIVDQMKNAEAELVSSLFSDVVIALPYYNDVAKRSALAKYTPALLRASAASDPTSVLVARIGADTIGFCLSRYEDDLLWLDWFGVHPLHRRKKIGTTLLKKLEEIARKGGTHKIWCDCRTNNEPSKLCLMRQQYTQICTVRNHWYRQDFILWERLIS